MNNPFNDKINKAVAEAARKVMEQSVEEGYKEDSKNAPFAGPHRDATKPAKDKFGNVIKNRAKSLAKQGMAGVRKEEVEQMSEEYVIHKGKHEPGRVSSLGGQTLHGVTVKHVYTDKKEAQAHADAINKGRGYKPEDHKNPLYGGVLYQVSPAKSMNEEAEQIAEKAKWRSSSAAKPDPDHDWDRSPRSTGGMRATSDTRGDTGGEYSHSSLENRKKAQVASKGPNAGKTTKASNASLKGRILGNLANKQSKPNLPEEVEQIDEAPYMGKGNHKPGWMLRADPKLAKAFKDAEERIKERRARQAKWAGVSIPSKSDKMEEEAEHMDESRRWNPDGSPKNVGLKAAKKFGKEQDQKTALHHFAKGAAKDDLSKFKKEETSHIAERLIGKQHKIDANKNGKIDAHDFKLLRKKSKMMKESYLVEDTTPALSAAMKAILADAFHMYFKAHTFHWNVEGANFPEYHKFFGDVYEQLFDTIDPIAEEIRALGEYAPRSLTELKGSTSIDDSSVQTPAEMFGSLLADNSKILAGLTNGYKVAEAAGEIGLSNFLQDKIDAHKKLGWMIKSVSKGA